MTFSICIPNYNYGRYIGEAVGSVLSQSVRDVEVLVSDNCSTDDSVAVVQGLGDPRVRVRVNTCNVGFAGNLDRAVAMASGERLLLLSSDDRMLPGALDAYERLYAALGEAGDRVVVTAGSEVIDGDGRHLRRRSWEPALWRARRVEPELSAAVGAPVVSIAAVELLRASLLRMRNPLHFVATMYSRWLYDAVGGYGGGRLVNPDKWFNWKILAHAERVYFVERELFSYRWHANNQAAQERSSGALKHLVDQYVATFDLPKEVLERAGLRRDDLERAFLEHDVVLRGLRALARGDDLYARRAALFGRATYPSHARLSWKLWGLRLLVAAGPAGAAAARLTAARGEAAWRARAG